MTEASVIRTLYTQFVALGGPGQHNGNYTLLLARDDGTIDHLDMTPETYAMIESAVEASRNLQAEIAKESGTLQ